MRMTTAITLTTMLQQVYVLAVKNLLVACAQRRRALLGIILPALLLATTRVPHAFTLESISVPRMQPTPSLLSSPVWAVPPSAWTNGGRVLDGYTRAVERLVPHGNMTIVILADDSDGKRGDEQDTRQNFDARVFARELARDMACRGGLFADLFLSESCDPGEACRHNEGCFLPLMDAFIVTAPRKDESALTMLTHEKERPTALVDIDLDAGHVRIRMDRRDVPPVSERRSGHADLGIIGEEYAQYWFFANLEYSVLNAVYTMDVDGSLEDDKLLLDDVGVLDVFAVTFPSPQREIPLAPLYAAMVLRLTLIAALLVPFLLAASAITAERANGQKIFALYALGVHPGAYAISFLVSNALLALLCAIPMSAVAILCFPKSDPILLVALIVTLASSLSPFALFVTSLFRFSQSSSSSAVLLAASTLVYFASCLPGYVAMALDTYGSALRFLACISPAGAAAVAAEMVILLEARGTGLQRDQSITVSMPISPCHVVAIVLISSIAFGVAALCIELIAFATSSVKRRLVTAGAPCKDEDVDIAARLSTVTKRYRGNGDTAALRSVSVAIRSGAVTVLLGENGSGKSTMMSVLSGMEHITAGTIAVNTPRVVLCPQRDALWSALSVERHLAVAASTCAGDSNRSSNSTGGGSEMLVRDMLRTFCMETRARVPAGILSGGEKRTLSVMLALVSSVGGGAGNLLLLDEPTNGMDVDAADITRRAIRRIVHDWKCGVVVTCHDLRGVEHLADDVIVLSDGAVLFNGTKDAMKTYGGIGVDVNLSMRLVADSTSTGGKSCASGSNSSTTDRAVKNECEHVVAKLIHEMDDLFGEMPPCVARPSPCSLSVYLSHKHLDATSDVCAICETLDSCSDVDTYRIRPPSIELAFERIVHANLSARSRCGRDTVAKGESESRDGTEEMSSHDHNDSSCMKMTIERSPGTRTRNRRSLLRGKWSVLSSLDEQYPCLSRLYALISTRARILYRDLRVYVGLGLAHVIIVGLALTACDWTERRAIGEPNPLTLDRHHVLANHPPLVSQLGTGRSHHFDHSRDMNDVLLRKWFEGHETYDYLVLSRWEEKKVHDEFDWNGTSTVIAAATFGFNQSMPHALPASIAEFFKHHHHKSGAVSDTLESGLISVQSHPFVAQDSPSVSALSPTTNPRMHRLRFQLNVVLLCALALGLSGLTAMSGMEVSGMRASGFANVLAYSGARHIEIIVAHVVVDVFTFCIFASAIAASFFLLGPEPYAGFATTLLILRTMLASSARCVLLSHALASVIRFHSRFEYYAFALVYLFSPVVLFGLIAVILEQIHTAAASTTVENIDRVVGLFLPHFGIVRTVWGIGRNPDVKDARGDAGFLLMRTFIFFVVSFVSSIGFAGSKRSIYNALCRLVAPCVTLLSSSVKCSARLIQKALRTCTGRRSKGGNGTSMTKRRCESCEEIELHGGDTSCSGGGNNSAISEETCLRVTGLRAGKVSGDAASRGGGVSFSVHRGEVFLLIGANGSGKSSLMRLLIQEMASSSSRRMPGTARVSLTAGHGPGSLPGYCPQTDPLHELLSPAEHFNLISTLRRRTKKTSPHLSSRAVAHRGSWWQASWWWWGRRFATRSRHHRDYQRRQQLLYQQHKQQQRSRVYPDTTGGVVHFSAPEMLHKETRSLSGGNRRKTSVAMSMLTSRRTQATAATQKSEAGDGDDSQLTRSKLRAILDEPCVGLDSMSRRLFWESLHGIARTSGAGFVVSTHEDFEELERFKCARFAVLDAFVFTFVGTESELRERVRHQQDDRDETIAIVFQIPCQHNVPSLDALHHIVDLSPPRNGVDVVCGVGGENVLTLSLAPAASHRVATGAERRALERSVLDIVVRLRKRGIIDYAMSRIGLRHIIDAALRSQSSSARTA